jgi:methionyl aminopeptidase
MALIKTNEELKIIREAGKRLAGILGELLSMVVPGVSGHELDRKAEELIRAGGDTPAFLNYTPLGALRPYPATLCLSVNDEIVHGIPNERDRILQEGDIASLDLGLKHRGLFVDMARTVGVGKIDKAAIKLIEATKKSLNAGIQSAKAGKRISDIGVAVEACANKLGYTALVEELGGHGVGHALHEPPMIPNFRSSQKSQKIISGMVLAIEPMINEGSRYIILDNDGYTYKTKDGMRSAHFEDTIIISKSGPPEIATRL